MLEDIVVDATYGEFCSSLLSLPDLAADFADAREAWPHLAAAMVPLKRIYDRHTSASASAAPDEIFGDPLVTSYDCEEEAKLLAKWNDDAPETFGAMAGNGQPLRKLFAFIQAHPEFVALLKQYGPMILMALLGL